MKPGSFVSAAQVVAALVLVSAGSAAALGQANDARAAAINLPLNASLSGTLVGATNDALVPNSCGSAGTSPDVWYVVGPFAALTGVEVSLCGSATWDSVLQAFEVGPGNTLGTQWVCNDDTCGYQSRITFNGIPGKSYYVRVTTYANGAGGPFTLSAATVAPLPALSNGPDVTVGDCAEIANYGTGTSTGTTPGVAVRAFAVGTNSFNIGDRPAAWYGGTVRHPVIAQNMYRLLNGRFEQVGMSWLKYGFQSLNSSDYATCQQPPDGGAQLGVNCSDLYGTGYNGSQGNLGPRYQVNPTTGSFVANIGSIAGPTPGDAVGRRLQVKESDWNNAGAQYLVDTQYVTADDAQWNNGRNNVSYRRITPSGDAGVPAWNGGTVRQKAAIEAWPVLDSGVTLVPVDMFEMTQTATDPLPPNATQQIDTYTRFIVAGKVTSNGNGTWNYEYALANINSHRAVKSFSLRLPAGAVVTAPGFSAPLYHSYDRINNNPWVASATTGVFRSGTDMAYTPTSMVIPGLGSTPMAIQPNYLYWGTTYNVRFTASVAPRTGVARLELARPANATGYQGGTLAVNGLPVPSACAADVGRQGGLAGPDGNLDNNEFIAFIDAFFNGNTLLADVGAQGGVALADNALDNNDFIVFINAFFAGCN